LEAAQQVESQMALGGGRKIRTSRGTTAVEVFHSERWGGL
jgi:hypothetical protein